MAKFRGDTLPQTYFFWGRNAKKNAGALQDAAKKKGFRTRRTGKRGDWTVKVWREHKPGDPTWL